MNDIVLHNLLSPAILFFILGLAASFAKSDLKFPSAFKRILEHLSDDRDRIERWNGAFSIFDPSCDIPSDGNFAARDNNPLYYLYSMFMVET